MSDTWSRGRIVSVIKNSRLSPLLRILAIIVLALLLIGIYSIYKVISPTLYVAKQDNFKINFPGTPTVSKLPSEKTSSGVEVSGKIYSVENQAKGTDYAVYVTSYTNENFNSLSKSTKTDFLENETEVLAKQDQSNLSDGKVVTFEGLTAVEAKLTPTDQSDASTELLAFLKTNKIYVILGGSIKQATFNAFTKSFHFID